MQWSVQSIIKFINQIQIHNKRCILLIGTENLNPCINRNFPETLKFDLTGINFP